MHQGRQGGKELPRLDSLSAEPRTIRENGQTIQLEVWLLLDKRRTERELAFESVGKRTTGTSSGAVCVFKRGGDRREKATN